MKGTRGMGDAVGLGGGSFLGMWNVRYWIQGFWDLGVWGPWSVGIWKSRGI